jgi:transposase
MAYSSSGLGLRRHEPPSRAWAAQLAARGKHWMIIWTALANRANRIAFAMVGDQTLYEPARSS